MVRKVDKKIKNVNVHCIQRCIERGMKGLKPNYSFVKRNYKQFRETFIGYINNTASNKQIKKFNYYMITSNTWLPGENIYCEIGDGYVVVIRDQSCITFLKKEWIKRFEQEQLD